MDTLVISADDDVGEGGGDAVGEAGGGKTGMPVETSAVSVERFWMSSVFATALRRRDSLPEVDERLKVVKCECLLRLENRAWPTNLTSAVVVRISLHCKRISCMIKRSVTLFTEIRRGYFWLCYAGVDTAALILTLGRRQCDSTLWAQHIVTLDAHEIRLCWSKTTYRAT